MTFIQVEARNFPQNKLVNLVKTNFVFAGFNLIVFVQNKALEKCIFMDDLFRTRALDIWMFSVQTWLLFAPRIKISGYAPGLNDVIRQGH